MLTNRPRGTNDIIPGEVEKWQYTEDLFRKLCREYGYAQVRTPFFEHTELFNRSAGIDTDVVEKEMYTFQDRGKRSISLRPEGTAPVARAYLENNLRAKTQPVKLFYTGAMFRYDRPQAGRYRQFHQLGVEVFGAASPCIDAEIMAMAMDFVKRLNLNLNLQINSVGCPHCRPGLRKRLKEYFQVHKRELCADCLRRLESNPLRVLDCKAGRCRDLARHAPATLDSLCAECADHFQKVQTLLHAVGIDYTINRYLVRGLDYYTKTAFEITPPGTGAQGSVGGGGRYDNLLAALGGTSTPGTGYALGQERLLLAMQEQGVNLPGQEKLDVFLASANGVPEKEALKLLQFLRQKGFAADKDYLGRSLKAQMKHAGKTGAPVVAIMGQEELARGLITIRNMTAGAQKEVPVHELAGEILKIIGERKH